MVFNYYKGGMVLALLRSVSFPLPIYPLTDLHESSES